MIKNITLGIAVLALILGGIALSKDSGIIRETIREVAVGSSAGLDHYNRESFRSGITAGGRVATTSPEGTSSYTTHSKDFNGTPTYVDWLPNNDITVSFSATSTHEYIPNIGDVATTYWRNASTTAGATITFAAVDGGVDLQYTEATGGDLVLNGLDWAVITYIRESVNLVTVIFDEFTEGD